MLSENTGSEVAKEAVLLQKYEKRIILVGDVLF